MYIVRQASCPLFEGACFHSSTPLVKLLVLPALCVLLQCNRVRLC